MKNQENVTVDQAIQDIVNDGFQSMTNGERSTTNLSIRDLLELKKQEQKEQAANKGRVFGKVKIKNNSARF